MVKILRFFLIIRNCSVVSRNMNQHSRRDAIHGVRIDETGCAGDEGRRFARLRAYGQVHAPVGTPFMASVCNISDHTGDEGTPLRICTNSRGDALIAR